jgi:hypothetical protein
VSGVHRRTSSSGSWSPSMSFDVVARVACCLWPLYADEMRVKLDEGLDRLLDLMDEARLLEIVRPDRPSVAPARGLRRRMRRSKP